MQGKLIALAAGELGAPLRSSDGLHGVCVSEEYDEVSNSCPCTKSDSQDLTAMQPHAICTSARAPKHQLPGRLVHCLGASSIACVAEL